MQPLAAKKILVSASFGKYPILRKLAIVVGEPANSATLESTCGIPNAKLRMQGISNFQ